jgi:hypothetical protein
MRKVVHNDTRDLPGRICRTQYRQEAKERLKFYVAKYQKTTPKLSVWMEKNLPGDLTVLALPAEHRQLM